MSEDLKDFFPEKKNQTMILIKISQRHQASRSRENLSPQRNELLLINKRPYGASCLFVCVSVNLWQTTKNVNHQNINKLHVYVRNYNVIFTKSVLVLKKYSSYDNFKGCLYVRCIFSRGLEVTGTST